MDNSMLSLDILGIVFTLWFCVGLIVYGIKMCNRGIGPGDDPLFGGKHWWPLIYVGPLGLAIYLISFIFRVSCYLAGRLS